MIDPDTKEKIIELFYEGWTKSKIAKKLKISRTTVANIIEEYETDNADKRIQSAINLLDNAMTDNATAGMTIKMMNNNGIYTGNQLINAEQNAVADYQKKELIKPSEIKIKLLDEIAELGNKKLNLLEEVNTIFGRKAMLFKISELTNEKAKLENEVIELEKKIKFLEEHKFDNRAYNEGFIDCGEAIINNVEKDPERAIIKNLMAKSILRSQERLWNTFANLSK